MDWWLLEIGEGWRVGVVQGWPSAGAQGRPGGGGAAGGPPRCALHKNMTNCHKAHAREAHARGSGAAGPGKGVGMATRGSGRWTCRGKCSGGRRA